MIRFINLQTGNTYDGCAPYTHYFDDIQSINLQYVMKLCFVSNVSTVKLELDDDNEIFHLLNLSTKVNDKKRLETENINDFDYVNLDTTFVRNNRFVELKSKSIDKFEGYFTSFGYVYIVYVVASSDAAAELHTQLHITELNAQRATYDVNVCADFNCANEAIVTNVVNYGMDIPRTIQQAIYETNVHDDAIDEALLNRKWKELLINLKDIIINRGNYKSLENSLRWFEYGEHLHIFEYWSKNEKNLSKLLRRDLTKFFDEDVQLLVQNQIKTTYISLALALNEFRHTSRGFVEYEQMENGSQNVVDALTGESIGMLLNADLDTMLHDADESYDRIFQMEGNTVGVFDWSTPGVMPDETCAGANLWRDHEMEMRPLAEPIPELYTLSYLYNKNELALKLALVNFYFEQYFMPIHLDSLFGSVEETIYTNVLKLINGSHIDRCDNVECFYRMTTNTRDDEELYLGDVNVTCERDTFFGDATLSTYMITRKVETISDKDENGNTYYTEKLIEKCDAPQENATTLGIIEQRDMTYSIDEIDNDTFFYNGIGVTYHIACDFTVEQRMLPMALTRAKICVVKKSNAALNENTYVLKTRFSQQDVFTKFDDEGHAHCEFDILFDEADTYQISLSFDTTDFITFTKTWNVVVRDTSENYVSIYKVERMSEHEMLNQINAENKLKNPNAKRIFDLSQTNDIFTHSFMNDFYSIQGDYVEQRYIDFDKSLPLTIIDVENNFMTYDDDVEKLAHLKGRTHSWYDVTKRASFNETWSYDTMPVALREQWRRYLVYSMDSILAFSQWNVQRRQLNIDLTNISTNDNNIALLNAYQKLVDSYFDAINAQLNAFCETNDYDNKTFLVQTFNTIESTKKAINNVFKDIADDVDNNDEQKQFALQLKTLATTFIETTLPETLNVTTVATDAKITITYTPTTTGEPTTYYFVGELADVLNKLSSCEEFAIEMTKPNFCINKQMIDADNAYTNNIQKIESYNAEYQKIANALRDAYVKEFFTTFNVTIAEMDDYNVKIKTVLQTHEENAFTYTLKYPVIDCGSNTFKFMQYVFPQQSADAHALGMTNVVFVPLTLNDENDVEYTLTSENKTTSKIRVKYDVERDDEGYERDVIEADLSQLLKNVDYYWWDVVAMTSRTNPIYKQLYLQGIRKAFNLNNDVYTLHKNKLNIHYENNTYDDYEYELRYEELKTNYRVLFNVPLTHEYFETSNVNIYVNNVKIDNNFYILNEKNIKQYWFDMTNFYYMFNVMTDIPCHVEFDVTFKKNNVVKHIAFDATLNEFSKINQFAMDKYKERFPVVMRDGVRENVKVVNVDRFIPLFHKIVKLENYTIAPTDCIALVPHISYTNALSANHVMWTFENETTRERWSPQDVLNNDIDELFSPFIGKYNVRKQLDNGYYSATLTYQINDNVQQKTFKNILKVDNRIGR